jgi:hypothetical protein
VILASVIWGGTQITPLRAAIAIAAEILVLLYFVWAFRLFGR